MKVKNKKQKITCLIVKTQYYEPETLHHAIIIEYSLTQRVLEMVMHKTYNQNEESYNIDHTLIHVLLEIQNYQQY